MKIRSGSTEVEIEAQDIIDSLTEKCRDSGWDSHNCICGNCVNGLVLNQEGLLLKKLIFKI